MECEIAWPEGLGGEEAVWPNWGDGFLLENSPGVYFKDWESVWSGQGELIWKSDANPLQESPTPTQIANERTFTETVPGGLCRKESHSYN